MNKNRIITVSSLGTITLIIVIVLDVLWGSTGWLATGAGEAGAKVLWHLRTPRVVTALLAGAALALAGAQLQSILRNPLADPHILGVTSGASLGAASITLMTNRLLSSTSLPIAASTAGAAFIGALLSSAVVLLASRKLKSPTSLLIFGVMLGYIVNALVSILQFSSDADSLKLFYSWSAGSFSMTSWGQIIILGISLIIGTAIALFNHKGLDIMFFGDEFAEMSGAEPHKIRLVSILSCCILTGAVTAYCGPLGFAGIIAPHIARAVFSTSSHKIIIPASMLIGALICTTADLLSQTADVPLPISSTMALIGIPVILFILLKKPVL